MTKPRTLTPEEYLAHEDAADERSEYDDGVLVPMGEEEPLMTTLAPPKILTPEEYLAHEDAADERSEYDDGVLIPMAGATINHSRIVRNVVRAFEALLDEQQYEIFMSDVRLWIADINRYTYPDVMVVAGAPILAEGRHDSVTNPLLIVEVLSESTRSRDRGSKFASYRTIASVQEYLIIDQASLHVEHCVRTDTAQWLLTDHTGPEAVVALHSVPGQLALADLYARVAGLA